MLICPKCGGDAHILSLNDDFDNLYTCSVCRNCFNPKETKMLASNSKLTPAEKVILREYRTEQAGTVLYRNFNTTVVAKFGPTVVRFATSVRSPNETKNRNKVGEYRARCRFENGEVSVLTCYDFGMLVENADFEEVVKEKRTDISFSSNPDFNN